MMLKNFWPVFVWAIFIMILSGIPGNMIPEVKNFWNWPGPDKLVHFILYAILAYLLLKCTAWQIKMPVLRGEIVFFLLLVGIIFGGLMEVLQEKIFINRDGNFYDFIANAIGCTVGFVIYRVTSKKNLSK